MPDPSYVAIVKRLGGKAVLGSGIDSELAFIEVVRAGLPVSALDVLADHLHTVVRQSEVFGLIGNTRTLQRKRAKQAKSSANEKRHRDRYKNAATSLRKAKQVLSATESDRLARLARLVVRAEEAIGDEERALNWLIAPNRALEGLRPLELLDSDSGALAVERVLDRIEYGVYS